MEYKDYYNILGIERSAQKGDIKRAYRKLARKYHPDVSKEDNAEAKFKEVNEAYEVLKDQEKRDAYDLLGENGQYGQYSSEGFQPPPNWQDNVDFSSGGYTDSNKHDFSSFFADLFGHSHAGASPSSGQTYNSKGDNIRAKVSIDLEDSINNTTRSFTLQMPEMDASGQVTNQQRTLKVKIPKGIKAGQTIRLAKQGSAGIGDAPAGDLLLEIAFNEHQIYKVDGSDIYLNLPVTPWELALGAKIKIPTPTGKVGITIPANSQQGRKLRLKGRGLPSKQAGDFYVVLQVSIPPSTDPKAKMLYEQMQKELDYNPRSYLF
ncbi:MAG TPA: J domain-containing protein [Thiothrix sp.]|nr:J domain-containing protein [Thiothrix sp.]